MDLSDELLQEAKIQAENANVSINFRTGNMLDLRNYYPPKSFTKVICLWLSFNHLLTELDQVTCLNEIYYVLQPGGHGNN